MIPKRIKRPKMNVRESSVVRCPSRLKWVRGHECCVAGHLLACSGRIEAHHLQEFRASEGGMGLKVGDDRVVPLCSFHHADVHNVGQPRFEQNYSRALRPVAEKLWDISPHGKQYRQQHHGE